MPERILRQSALAPEQLLARGIRLGERTELGKIELRGDPGERSFMTGVGRVLDLLLPTEPNSSASKNAITALWLGPDQWLLTCPADDAAFFINSLREALADIHAAVTDQSDGRVAFVLAGPSARDVLAKSCPLDLHPQSFTPGSAAQSLLAKADVLLHLRADDPQAGPTFDLYVARSYAAYLWAWLADAGLEYGVQIEPSS
jgi:sarcosine oxidase subunit gamma